MTLPFPDQDHFITVLSFQESSTSGLDWDGKSAGEDIQFGNLEVDFDLVELFGFEMKEGRSMELYSGMDVQDKFIYAEELAEMRKFFLGFQIVYFRVGNENIANQSDERNTMRRNKQTIIGNFNSYLEGLRREKAYGPYAANLGEGITTHFTKLIETFPNANYKGMLSTAKAMQGKVETPEVKKALSGLIAKLESIQNKTTDPI